MTDSVPTKDCSPEIPEIPEMPEMPKGLLQIVHTCGPVLFYHNN